MSLDKIFLPYQQRWIGDESDVKVCEKGRRTGLTWAEAADDVLIAATEGKGGMDVLYLGYNQEMTREFIDTCATWARRFQKAADQVGEFIYRDEDRDILAFRIKFASGHEIVALSSAPRNLRGRQGVVVLDEAAFHPELAEVLKAALALLIWGGKLRIISTHDGADNYFNDQLVEKIRSGELPYSLHRISFDDALCDGLYRRICRVKDRRWSLQAEAEWRTKIIAQYGDGADEELFCIPSQGSGVWLTRNIIEACMRPDIPVLRWTPPADDFVDWPLSQAEAEVDAWCSEHLDPLLDGLPRFRSFLGEDFGRNGDLTVLWPLQELPGLELETPFVLELRNAPFRTQEQILFRVCDGLPRFCGGALDARGNGQALAEFARQRYGADRIHEVMLSESWYREHGPKLKAQLEDRTLSLPRDADILDDLRAFKMVKGVARVPEHTKDKKGQQRHGDSGIAAMMAVYAAKSSEYTGAVEYRGDGERMMSKHAGAW